MRINPEEHFEEFFIEIVRKCIEKDLIKTNRCIIDFNDVAANVNYPSEKKLARPAFEKVLKEVSKFNEPLALKLTKEIEQEYEKNERVSWCKHFEITQKYLNILYLKTYDELQHNEKYSEAFGIYYDLLYQYINNIKDKIVSIVDSDARVVHKSPEKIKWGYKDRIIVDEDSEIILSSVQTSFNVDDEKKLQELVEKTEKNFKLKPEKLSADKVYETNLNRAFLADNEIISNIDFYKERERLKQIFGIGNFSFSKDFTTVRCPNNIETSKFKIKYDKTRNRYKGIRIWF